MIFTQFMDLKPWARFYTEGCHGVTPVSRAVPSQSLDPRIKNRSRLAYTLAEMEAKQVDPTAVSYTHLTLPTSALVEISVGAGSLKKKAQGMRCEKTTKATAWN